MIESIYKEARENMGNSITSLKNELKKIRTGRASVGVLDGITVDYYGNMSPLNQVSSLSVPESRLILIQPWDVGMIKEIEKAILKSDLGLTPVNDGKVVRISIPQLTEERRKELVKVVQKICEAHKVAVRNIRRDYNHMIKNLKNDGDISEDDAFKAQENIQKVTDEYILLIEDDIGKEKKKEILEI